jgi:hypothetical protein
MHVEKRLSPNMQRDGVTIARDVELNVCRDEDLRAISSVEILASVCVPSPPHQLLATTPIFRP